METKNKLATLDNDSLVAIGRTMQQRLNSAVATGRIDIAQDSKIILDRVIREIKRRGVKR